MAALVMTLHLAALSLPADLHLRTLLSDLFLPVESVSAAALLFAVSFREKSAGKRAFAAWLMLALAQAFVAGSEIQWSVVEIVTGSSPFPSLGDIVYLLSYPAFFAGAFLLFPPRKKPGERLGQLLDIGIIGISVMLMLWVFLLGPVLSSPSVSGLLDGISVMYLLGDIALVSTLLVLVYRGSRIISVGSQWLFAGSVAARILADSLFAFQAEGGIFANGNASDAAYGASSLAAFCVALLQITRRGSVSRRTRRPVTPSHLRDLVDWRTHLPFLGVLCVFFIFMWSRAHPIPLGEASLGIWTGLILGLSIARQALQGIENARLNRELDRRVQERTISLTEANLELFLLSKVRAAIAKELDLSVVLKTIVEAVAETLGYSMVALYLRDGDSLVLQHAIGYSNVIRRLTLTKGVMGRVARTGAPALVGNTRDDADFLTAVTGVASEVTVPLLDYGVVEGVLTVESMVKDAFDQSDMRLLSEVADYAAMAIVRARYVSLLRESQDQLEHRVEERTTELRESQERLRQAEKMEAIGRLAGGVAHDFNNMLTVIMGHGQLLVDSEELSEEDRQAVGAMLESAQRAASLTHQLLTFSRQQVIDVRTLDLGSVVDEMSDMIARLVGQHVRLEVRSGDSLWPVHADRVHLEQVLLNLSANAADAMKDGGALEIETSNLETGQPVRFQMTQVPAGSYVVLTVRDTGEGMPAEVQQHVFEPFFTTKSKGEGTGLGLATVYGIVKQAKGFIGLESAPGQGTTFRIFFPAYPGEYALRPPGGRETEAQRGNESILVVDDQKEVRSITVLMLRSLGYSVTEASSGRDALALLEGAQTLPDLMITDVSMPDMTGVALLKEIEKTGTAPRTVFMSGYANDAFDASLKDAMFLQKPFTARTLARAVRKALDE